MKPVLSKQFSTHFPMLIKFVQATDGPVAEMGGGYFSTPLLHWICAESGRKLRTYDDDPSYEKFIRSFRSRNHRIIMVKDWEEFDISIHWSVILVDHTNDTSQRMADIRRIKNSADYIIVHDAERLDPRIYEEFKSVFLWEGCVPKVAVLSNFKDTNI